MNENQLMNLARLVIISSINNIIYWADYVIPRTNQQEKQVLRNIADWAKGHVAKIKRLRNPQVIDLYNELNGHVSFTQEILSLAITVDPPSRESFLQWAAKYINYINDKAEGHKTVHPEWIEFGEPDSEMEITEERILIDTKGVPNNEEMCIIKTHQAGFPIITVYDKMSETFIDYSLTSPVQYNATQIYKWRSIND